MAERGPPPAQAAGAKLLEDESKFIDLPNSPLWMAYEYPQINPSPERIAAHTKSGVVRVFFPLRHQTQIAEEDARHYWLTHHGPIARSHGGARRTTVPSHTETPPKGHTTSITSRTPG